MKVILTGSTGFIGHEVLTQCTQNPAITSIVALSRRELPTHPRLNVQIIDDFSNCSDSVIGELQGASACIWTLGKATVPNNDVARRIHIEYPLSGIKTFTERIAQRNSKFRFIFCSGAAAERDQTKPLWFGQEYRRIRGEAENQLLAYAKENDVLETYILRPGMVLSRQMSLRTLVFGLGPSIWVDRLAEVMVDIAVKGARERILENPTMVNWAGDES